LQWNTLATCYEFQWKYPKPIRQYVDFSYRKDLIAQEISSYNADIICLEEVDSHDLEFFITIFPYGTYSNHYSKKTYSRDGSLIFIRKTFQIEEAENFSHYKSNGVDLDNPVSNCVVIKTNNNCYIIVVATHLKAGIFCRSNRKLQAEQLADFVVKKKQKYLELLGNNQKDLAVVICGDLNDDPTSSPILALTTNKKLQLQSPFDTMNYTSVCPLPIIPYLFTFVMISKSTIDYILHSDNIQVTKKISEAKDADIGDKGLPVKEYPSDHISLFCEFVLE